ncbi:FtsK/SpoIIIE family DNA translocase [Deinococcus maricopensis]|uniref:Cell division protein FtsK/SpoIIIE n=1 Tax=Deinococcus maricopensis (strain DSM 21211 / LMG 22137 / NRRL B-23946 / LB-34) TaxID=709986 RepID=E8U7J4_DEIML|nr:DNA translocase FtsK [Deinococcus maricopensis]ADV67033.1 cell division protein FtsK/SpoIIIE [Deinococcus maricopensis DSM 21211]
MAKRRAKRSLSTSNRFDGEALGLVLFALGIFLAVTVFVRPGGTGFMAQAHTLLVTWLAWGAYALPVIPLGYGALVFLGREVRTFTRLVLGGLVVMASLLALSAVFTPGDASNADWSGGGQAVTLLMAPLTRAVGYAAALLPLVTLTLGAELLGRREAFTFMKGFFRSLSFAVVAGAGGARDLVEARQVGLEQTRRRVAVRNALSVHARDLEGLAKLYPDARELDGWQREVKGALRSLHDRDEAGLKALEKDLQGWRDVTKTFVTGAAQDLRARVAAEAPTIAADIEVRAQEIRSGQHELSGELASTLASGALERVRRALVMDAYRLANRAGSLERDRKRAEKALERADAGALARELPAMDTRTRDWADLADGVTDWMTRAALYPGWPDLVEAMDRAPAELAAQFAQDLTIDPDATLRARPTWEARLERLLLERAEAEAAVPPRPAAPAVAAPLLLDLTFDAPDVAPTPAVALPPAPTSGPLFPPPAPATPAPQRPREKVTAPVTTPAAEASSAEQLAPAPSPALAPVPVSPAPAPTSARYVDLAALGEDDEDELDMPFPVARTTPAAAPVAPTPAPRATRLLVEERLPWEEDDEPAGTLKRAAEEDDPRERLGAIDIEVPGLELLDPIPHSALDTAALDASARTRADLINQTLSHFGIQGRVVDFARGPTVTRYEIEPAPGEKIARIASLSNDLARALAVGGVRVEAPVPGKSVIGLEVPNTEREPVTFHAAAINPSFRGTRAKLPIILGKSIDGDMMVGDLAKMPHLLIAGSTGSGKSVCVNTLITSLLYRYLPTELRFLMVDPKMVELTPYDGIPHLVRGVITNPMDAAGVLLGAVAHMERRYKMMSQAGAKNLEQFNAKMRQVGEAELPHLVIIIDELADLMITSPKEVESAIMRLAQMARATGMHLVLATQRPSVDILTSLIKVNVPARIAFAVSSSHDSRTILDAVGAERLTGMGDMLFYQPGLVKPLRLQGPYISETESVRITEFLRRQVFEDWFVEAYGSDFDGAVESGGGGGAKGNMDFSDPLLRQAAEICIEEGQGSVSRLQRRLSVGHARAGKLMDMLEAMGIVSKHQGSKPREVLISVADLPDHFGR